VTWRLVSPVWESNTPGPVRCTWEMVGVVLVAAWHGVQPGLPELVGEAAAWPGVQVQGWAARGDTWSTRNNGRLTFVQMGRPR